MEAGGALPHVWGSHMLCVSRVSVRAGSLGGQMANLLAVEPCQALNEITLSALIPPGGASGWGQEGCGLGGGDAAWLPSH